MGSDVCAAMVVYEEARCLPMALGCLPDDMPVVVVDGAYEEFPHEQPHSDDGTCQIAERWGAHVMRVTEPWRDQCVKRTAACDYAATFAPVVLVLDADEMLEGDVPVLQEGCDVGWVWIRSSLYPQPYLQPRLYRWRAGWHFERRHHWIYDRDGVLVTSHQQPGSAYTHTITHGLIHNMREWRSKDRDGAKRLYRTRRNVHEDRYRQE